MNTFGIKQGMKTLFVFGTLLFSATALSETPKEDECSNEILLSYFPSVFVENTLEQYKIPKDQREAIKKELAARDGDHILAIVEAKGAKLNPNPLLDPQLRQATMKIWRETLLENFSAVMKAHGTTDDKKILAMLDDVQQQKAKRFARCMSQEQTQQPSGQMKKVDSSEDENDRDYEDDESDASDDEYGQDDNAQETSEYDDE